MPSPSVTAKPRLLTVDGSAPHLRKIMSSPASSRLVMMTAVTFPGGRGDAGGDRCASARATI